jgi:hypothetical protein
LKKKGVGRGIHQSDVIRSMFGWLKDASQSLGYGKNYKGYWTGEIFVKQVGLVLTESSAMKSYILCSSWSWLPSPNYGGSLTGACSLYS